MSSNSPYQVIALFYMNSLVTGQNDGNKNENSIYLIFLLHAPMFLLKCFRGINKCVKMKATEDIIDRISLVPWKH